MKTIIVTFVLFTLSFAAMAQQEVKSQAKKETQPVKKTVVKAVPLPADDKDPVCFMKVKKGSLITTTYKEKIYGFCSEHCKGVFLADPEEQLKPVLKN
mgnify:CR=1 FL=1